MDNIAGDLLRAEQQRPGSTYGAMIKEYITEGKIVPMEVTVKVSTSTSNDANAKYTATRKRYARYTQESAHFPHRLSTRRKLARRKRTILDRRIPKENGSGNQV
jgi:adenylate kinase family enzyme